MEIQLINEDLLNVLHEQAAGNERRRQHFDLRNTAKDGSQRMLNVLEPGTKVDIHRHTQTAETILCIKGSLDLVFYRELPNMDAGGPGREFTEIYRVTLGAVGKVYGIQVPQGAWHTIEVKEPSVIFEAKDGAYGK